MIDWAWCGVFGGMGMGYGTTPWSFFVFCCFN
jgi:hypothetical protein